MKKLLGILGTITIAGSGTAGLVGNAPASAKKEINYLQENSLKKLSRVKRRIIPARIKLFNLKNEEKLQIGIDEQNRKIKFFSFAFDNTVQHTIRILDKNKNTVKVIPFFNDYSTTEIINMNNIASGISYEDGYIIVVWSSMANKTRFLKNDNQDYWVWNTSEGAKTEKFIIMGNKIYEPNALIEKFPNLISRPLIRRTSNNNQNNYAPNLVIDEWDDNLRQYYDSLISIVDYLNREGIIEQLGRTNGTYRLNNQNGYFIVGIQFQSLSNLNHTVELVFDRSNLYLQGFILREDNGRKTSAYGTYYYFSDSTYRTNLGINHLTNINLNFGGSYTNLIAGGDINISSQSMFNSFRFLASFINSDQQRTNISSNLMRIILFTSEALRFNNIISTIQNNNNPISWRNYFSNLLTNWGSLSREYIRRVNSGTQIWDPVNDNSSRVSPALLAFLLNVRILNNK